MTAGDYPALFRIADAGSGSAQRTYKRLITIELSFAVIGAFLAAVISVLGAPQQVAAAVGAMAFGGAILARIISRNRQDHATWFDDRAVAETIKTQTWQYVMRVPPYADDATADRAFLAGLRASVTARPAVPYPGPVSGESTQITPTMRQIRAKSLPERAEVYVSDRLTDQIDWYRRSAIRHRRVSERWSLAALITEAGAVVAALVAIFSTVAANLGLLGLFASASASFAAGNQLGRHDELSRSYGLAYQELLAISGGADSLATEEDLVTLVRDGEGAISREHTMWTAKRSKAPSDSTG